MTSVRVYYPDYNEEHQRVLHAFAHGIPDAEFVEVSHYEPSDIAVIFGTYKYAIPQTGTKRRIIRQQNKTGGRVIYLETGYLRRDRYYAVAVGGMLGAGTAYYLESPPDRFERLGIEVKPPQSRRFGSIILAGQVPWDANVQDNNHTEWIHRTFYELQDEYGTGRVIFRPHPKFRGRDIYVDFGIPQRFHSRNERIEDDLADAHKLVCWNSNSALDALIEGVSVDIRGQGSIWTQTKSFNDIAYAQWLPEEMASGEAWEHVKKVL